MSIGLSSLYPLYSLDPRTVWKGQFTLLLIAVAATAAMVIPLNAGSRVLRWLKICCVAGIATMTVLQFALLASYVFYPSYINHGEALVTEISWLNWEGYPLYPRPDTGDVYAEPYGPALFQATGFFLWLFGPSIAASKILGLTAFALSQVLSFVTLRFTGAPAAEALTMTAVQCIVLAGFTPEGVVSGVRPDPLMFFAAQTAVLTATAAPTMLTAVALGLLGGISLNVRIDGALYILPAFAYLLSRSSSPMAGLRMTCITGLVGIIAAVVPFSPENVSPVQYYHLFQVTSRHPWQRWVFEQNVVFAAMLLLPLLGMHALFRPKLPVAFKWFIATLVLSVTLETFPAAESGAGPHHLLLFLPSVVWGFVVLRRAVWAGLSDTRTRGRYEGFSLGLMAALLLGYGPIVVTSWGTVLHRFAYAQFFRAARAEIDSALEDNRGLKVAVGPGRLSVNADPAAFDPEMLRVIPVFRGNPLPLDSAVWMNFQAEGISDDSIRRAITECRVDLWVLPAGAPFVTISHYNGEDIFSPQVLADFHAAYVKQGSGRIFDQWRCKRDGAASKKIQEAP